MFTLCYLELAVRFNQELMLTPETVVSGINPPPVYQVSSLLRIAVLQYCDQHRVAVNLKANDFASKFFGGLQLV